MTTVSVVVPVFNGLPHLKQAVDSILGQTHADLDIVLMDGGSTDGSADWMRTVTDPRVRAMQAPPGTGAAGNWTASSSAAAGAYIKLLCQDDVLHPTAIADQLADLTQHPDAFMAVAQRDVIDARGRTLYQRRGCAGLTGGPMSGMAALRASYLTGTNVFGEPVSILFRRSTLLDALPWNDERPFLLDLELYTRVLRRGGIVVRLESVGAFRVSDSSWSTRLVESQTAQLRTWQHEVAALLDPPPTDRERRKAERSLRKQTALRRVAYRALKLRGAFASAQPD